MSRACFPLRLAGVMVAVAFASLGVPALRAEIIEQVLVKVNGDILTRTDLETLQVSVLRQRGQPFDLKQGANDEALRRALDEITPPLLVDTIDELLQLQRGKELGYRMTEERFKTILDSIKKDNKLETEAQFQAALQQERTTLADLRKNIERRVIVSQVQQAEVLGRIGVSEGEARKYYDEHRDQFTTQPAITLRELLVAVPSDGQTVNVGLDEEAKTKAEAVRARIVTGESLEKLAAELSDSPSKANAGIVGPLGREELSPDFRALIDKMKPGDLSPVVRTPRGYQLFRLESIAGAETMPFEQARDRIADRVFGGKRQEELAKYLAKLRAQAIIEFKNAEIKRAYDEGLAKQAAASQPSERP